MEDHLYRWSGAAYASPRTAICIPTDWNRYTDPVVTASVTYLVHVPNGGHGLRHMHVTLDVVDADSPPNPKAGRVWMDDDAYGLPPFEDKEWKRLNDDGADDGNDGTVYLHYGEWQKFKE